MASLIARAADACFLNELQRYNPTAYKGCKIVLALIAVYITLY